jgi:type IV pilus assembly protein PilY1
MSTSPMSRLALAGSLALALSGPVTSMAADIDLYAAGGTAGSEPNLLFFIDNSSNWSAASQAWAYSDVFTKCAGNALCEKYTNAVFGTDTSLVQGQIELRALKLVLNELVCDSASTNNVKVNIGLMLFNPAGT